ncbi:hypothetical protein F5883DRAFT_184032 [Diaporthe sp. PMI_573]|nr:hypothetical protein F5883DRAFT_184032 [Diaporthaceae sp. PMI_573]
MASCLQEYVPLSALDISRQKLQHYKIILKHPAGNKAILVQDLEGPIPEEVIWARVPDGASQTEPECDIQTLGIRQTPDRLECEVIGAAIDLVFHEDVASECIALHNMSSEKALVKSTWKASYIEPNSSVIISPSCWIISAGEEILEFRFEGRQNLGRNYQRRTP